jgi:hypothetical protein
MDEALSSARAAVSKFQEDRAEPLVEIDGDGCGAG